MAIDSLDEKLINLLMQDAHKSSEVLAKQLDVSSSTVRRRLKKLVKSGIINIIAIPEPSTIGLPLEAIIAFDVDHESLNSTIEILKKQPQVRWVAATSGRFDIMVYAWFSSTDNLYYFIESEIGGLEGLKSTETFICLHVAKHP